jgi:hypothetical protein
MTKIEMAKKIVADNSNASRQEIIQLFMSQLNMTKAGATTYAYNLAKGAPKSARTKTAKASKPAVSTKRAQTKEERLAVMKQVAAKRSASDAAFKADKASKQVVIDALLDDADEYVKSLTAPARKFIGMAE